MRKIIHIDMDCYFAAIEMRDFPELQGKPVAVGGSATKRGVIATCNYEARQYGVHSAMATGHALKLCPQLIIQPSRIDVYRAVSVEIRAIFAEYTDLIEPLSLDEAYLDVSESLQCQGSATWIAEAIRQQIYTMTHLTASAGVAPCKSLAKIASDWNKPNGIKVILPEEIDSFVKTLPVRKLFGVGPKCEQRLLSHNLRTCQDIQQWSLTDLLREFGSMGERLYSLSRGIDDRPVLVERIRKSISVEETYSKDLSNLAACLVELPGLITRLEARIRNADKCDCIQGITVKVKFNDFHQTTVERNSRGVNMDMLQELMAEGYSRYNKPVRLLGIGVKLKNHEQKGRQYALSLGEEFDP